MENSNTQDFKDMIKNRSYISSIIGIILTIGFGIFAIYTFFYKPKPNLEVIITTKTNVLDINASLSNMDILLDSISLKDRNENIKIFTLKFINTGEANIVPELYDSDVPIKINIKGGCIIDKPEVYNFSSDYVYGRLSSKIMIRDSSIIIPNIIFDVDEFAEIKFFVLHNNKIEPELEMSGKISGQDKIKITDMISVSKNKTNTLLNELRPSSLNVYMINFMLYGMQVLLLLMGLGYLSEKMYKRRELKKKKAIIAEFKKNNSVKSADNYIFDYYLKQLYNVSHNSIFNLATYNCDYLKDLYEEDVVNSKFIPSARENIDFLVDNGALEVNEEGDFRWNNRSRNILRKFNDAIEEGKKTK